MVVEEPFVLAGLSPALGRVITVDRLQPGEVNRARSYLEVAAGKATNAARVLRELGQDVILVSPLGDENHAHFRNLAAADGVEMDPVLYRGRVRWALTLVDDSSATEIIVGEPEPIPGDTASLIVERVQSHLPGAPACVVAGSRPGNIPVSVIAAIAGAARNEGVPLFLDIRGEDLLEALAAAGKEAPVVVKINEVEYRETMERAGLPGPEADLRVHGAIRCGADTSGESAEPDRKRRYGAGYAGVTVCSGYCAAESGGRSGTTGEQERGVPETRYNHRPVING